MLEKMEGGIKGMRNMKNGIFVELPKLQNTTLRLAFVDLQRVYLKDAGSLEKVEEISVVKRGWGWWLPCVFSRNQLERLSYSIQLVVVGHYCCNDEKLNVLDLSPFQWLKWLRVGMCCFENVKEVKLIGLSELRSVVIGKYSFTKFKNTWYDIRPDPDRHFYLKNCPKLKSLKMGRFSFADYKVIEIENVDALEVIEMGDFNYDSCNFKYASLELKSILIHRE